MNLDYSRLRPYSDSLTMIVLSSVANSERSLLSPTICKHECRASRLTGGDPAPGVGTSYLYRRAARAVGTEVKTLVTCRHKVRVVVNTLANTPNGPWKRVWESVVLSIITECASLKSTVFYLLATYEVRQERKKKATANNQA